MRYGFKSFGILSQTFAKVRDYSFMLKGIEC